MRPKPTSADQIDATTHADREFLKSVNSNPSRLSSSITTGTLAATSKPRTSSPDSMLCKAVAGKKGSKAVVS